MDVMLEARQLAKAYGVGRDALQVLGGISFAVGRGEFVSIVGPSGCGKTTLLFALAGLQRASSGTVTFNGRPVTAPPRGVAVVFRTIRVRFSWKSNRDNVAFGMVRVDGLSAAQKRDKAQEMLEAVGLQGFEDKYPCSCREACSSGLPLHAG